MSKSPKKVSGTFLRSSAPSKDLFALELFIAKLLRYGVFLAGILIFIGWASQIDFHEDTFSHFTAYKASPLIPALQGLWARAEYGLLISYLGLGVLISLPVLRVAMTGAVFIKQKDFIMAGLVALVLSGLILSFVLGFEI